MPPVAVQLYTLRDACVVDQDAVIAGVAALGFAGVELYSGNRAVAPDGAALGGRLRAHGLRVAAYHYWGDELSSSTFGDTVAWAHGVGVDTIVCAAPPAGFSCTRAAYDALAVDLNALGSTLRPHGLRFAFHNHADELIERNGYRGLDVLAASCDPDLVSFEVDVHWAAVAGADPVSLLTTLGDRCRLVHLKDSRPLDAPEGEPLDREIGTGRLDFDAIAAASATADWWIIEHDTCIGPELDSVGRSLDALVRMGLASR